MKILYPLGICILLVFSLYSQDPDLGTSDDSMNPSGNSNFSTNLWNETIGTCELDIKRSNSSESLMGNFVSDAMLHYTQADFAFISFGELYADLYKGEITSLDMFRLIPFNRTLVVMEITGDTLKQIIEGTLGGVLAGMAISGGKVEYDPNRPVQNRLTFVEIGSYSLYPKKEYRVVTIDYLANGNAGFDLLKNINPQHVFRTGTLLRDVLIDHIKQNSPLDQNKVYLDNRWTKK